MRIALLNELDSYALAGDMNIRDIIDGVSIALRIGDRCKSLLVCLGWILFAKRQKSFIANDE